MAQGQAKVKYVGSNADVMYRSATAWDFIYSTSLTKDPNHNIGDRVVLPDGREYRYSRATEALDGGHGCEFTYTGLVAYTAFAAAAAVGATEITIPAATHALLAKDALRGGMVVLFDGSTDRDTTTRGILGNDATAADVAFKVYLDGPIHNAIVAGTEAVEVFQNPWAAIQDGSEADMPKAGVPATGVSTALMYFWCQTKGLTWVSVQSTVNNNEGVGVMWRHDGSLDAVATALGATVPNADGTQYAGYRVAGSQSGNGPLVMLQG